MSVKVRHFSDYPVATTDGAMLVRGPGDTLITTGMRIEASPAPEVPRGGLGVVYTGDPGLPRQLALAQAAITEAGLLSAGDVAAIKAILAKYSGASAAPTNRTGVTGDAVRDARQAVAQVGAGVAAVQGISKANADFWDKRLAADEARILGR